MCLLYFIAMPFIIIYLIFRVIIEMIKCVFYLIGLIFSL